MSRRFVLRVQDLLLAIALIIIGIASVYTLNRTTLEIAGKNFTSIGILISALVAYGGVLVIISKFENETYLSIAILFPSILAVLIFVYGFIGWSIRVSLSKWKGLLFITKTGF